MTAKIEDRPKPSRRLLQRVDLKTVEEAPPVVFADLGYGVMDAAMVEAAAYCLEKREVTP